jgi:large subunit ribosomal protein L21
MYAVIMTGGKQYRVKEGDVLSVEKLAAGPGTKFHFDQVLLIEDGDNVLVGTPVLENALVRADIIETFKDEKVLIFKKKRRKQFRRTRGHRQLLTKVRIERVVPDKTSVPAGELRLDLPAVVPEKAPAVEAKPRAPKAAKPAPAEEAPKAAKPKPRKAAPAKKAPTAKAPAKKPAAAKPKKTTKE